MWMFPSGKRKWLEELWTINVCICCVPGDLFEVNEQAGTCSNYEVAEDQWGSRNSDNFTSCFFTEALALLVFRIVHNNFAYLSIFVFPMLTKTSSKI